MRKGLMITGLVSVTLGVFLSLSTPEPEEAAVLWEKIPDEEVQTVIQKEEPAEDIPEYGHIQECETGTIEKDAPAAGEVISFTYEEAQLLMKVAQAEAGNQGEDGMWLVMSTIVNRMRTEGHEFHPEGDHSVQGTVFKKYSFSSVWDGRYLEMELIPEVHEALARIEQGDVAEEVIGFEVKTSRELDKYFDEAFEYKDHRFYTLKKEPKREG